MEAAQGRVSTKALLSSGCAGWYCYIQGSRMQTSLTQPDSQYKSNTSYY